MNEGKYTLRIVCDDEIAPKVILKDCTFEEAVEYVESHYSEFKNPGIYISRSD